MTQRKSATLLFLTFMTGLLGCISAKLTHSDHSPSEYKQHLEEKSNAHIVSTFILRLTRNDTISYDVKINVLNKTEGKGSVKRYNLYESCNKCMYVDLVDENGNVIEHHRYQDPLYEEIEYLDEEMLYHNIIVKPTEKVFSIRTNTKKNVKQLRFKFSDSENRDWISIKL